MNEIRMTAEQFEALINYIRAEAKSEAIRAIYDHVAASALEAGSDMWTLREDADTAAVQEGRRLKRAFIKQPE